MPSTERRLELKVKDIDGSDHLTAGCVCQWVKVKKKKGKEDGQINGK
jgi:hypothetical protein